MVRVVWLLVGALLWSAPAAAQIGPSGAKAYDMARAAEDAAVAAHDEGTEALEQLQKLAPPSRHAAAVQALQDQAQAAAEALTGFRKQARSSVDETMDVLADLARNPRPEPGRREQGEQRALLAAYEASVMAARARSQAERLRALLAEAKAALAGAGATTESAARPPGPAVPPAGPGVVVPNLVGARLADATRDLAASGLRLGTTTGPRDGYVVKQSPAAGLRVAPQAVVGLTLSATAVGVTVLPPR